MDKKFENVFHHCNFENWLNCSTLSPEQRSVLINKYRNVDFSTLNVVTKLSPEEALYARKPLVKVICQTVKEIETPDAVNMLTGKELMTAFYRELACDSGAGGAQTLPYALITACRGNAMEKKHAKSMPRRKFSHHTYGNAVAKLMDQSKIYIESLKLEGPKSILTLTELPCGRVEEEHLIHGDFFGPNFFYDGGLMYESASLPMIKDLRSALKQCEELNKAIPQLRFFPVKINSHGLRRYVCRNAETYDIHGFMAVKTPKLSWLLYPKLPGQSQFIIDVQQKPMEFASIEEAFDFAKHTSYQEYVSLTMQERTQQAEEQNSTGTMESILNDYEHEVDLFGSDLKSLINEDVEDRKQHVEAALHKMNELRVDMANVANEVKQDGDLTRLTDDMKKYFPVTVEALYRRFYNPPLPLETPIQPKRANNPPRQIVSFESGYPEIRFA